VEVGASGMVRGSGVSVGLVDNEGSKATGLVLAEPVDAGRDGGVNAGGQDSLGADATAPRDSSLDSISDGSRASELSLITLTPFSVRVMDEDSFLDKGSSVLATT